MDKYYDYNMKFIMDSLKVIRNHMLLMRIYLPAILTFCAVTFFLTIFLHNINRPIGSSSSSYVIESLGLLGDQPSEPPKKNGISLTDNYNGYISYKDLLLKPNYLTNRQTCEYGSIWQTSQYLHGNISKSLMAEDADTRTLNLMEIDPLPYAPNYRSPCFFQKTANQDDVVLRCMPYFFLAGFPKCGTTDMYKRMEYHPLIAAPNEKEPLWFSRDRVIHKKLGIHTSFTKYITKFSKAQEETQRKTRRVSVTDEQGKVINSVGYHPLLIGDFSTRELFNERLAWDSSKALNAEIFRHLMPCTKFIISMRDPVERLYSDYVYFLKREPNFVDPKHFHKRVVQSIAWWEECTSKFTISKCLFGSPKEMPPVHTGLCFDCWQGKKICPNIRIGLYAYIIEEWLKLFPRESFLFIRMEDYTDHEIDVLNNQIFPFLGLSPLDDEMGDAVANMERQFPAKNEDVKEKLHAKGMLPETRDLLTKFYKESNQRLAELLDDKRYMWNS